MEEKKTSIFDKAKGLGKKIADSKVTVFLGGMLSGMAAMVGVPMIVDALFGTAEVEVENEDEPQTDEMPF